VEVLLRVLVSLTSGLAETADTISTRRRRVIKDDNDEVADLVIQVEEVARSEDEWVKENVERRQPRQNTNRG
jgi:hypothetical protein